MTQDLNTAISHLQTQIDSLNRQHQVLQLQTTQPLPVDEHRDLTFTINRAEDVSLHLFKTLPEFSGNRTSYATWRTIVKTAMKLLQNHETSMQFCQALMIVRNKITGNASNILNNYNTPFNFDAIIDRLDFTYADKRPLYILEQEMLVLQQNKLSIDEFYDKVNEKLNAIVNKINMTYTNEVTAKAFIETINEKGLRTFITGLNNRRGEILYASNPSSLPEAYAKLQTITNDQERMKFATRYNSYGTQRSEPFLTKNPRFRFRDNHENFFEQKPTEEPMEVDQTSTKVNLETKFNQTNTPNQNQTTGFKRNFSRQGIITNTSDQKIKQQRINKMEENYAKTIVEDDEFLDTQSCLSEDMSSKSSIIFLGE